MSRKDIQKIIEELYKKGLSYEETRSTIDSMRINESSLSRIWQFVEDDSRSFGFLSAARNELSDEENAKNHEELKNIIRSKGLGYIETLGGYEEVKSDLSVVKVDNEPSLFVPNIPKKLLIELGIKYNQDTVIYKDKNEFGLISTSATVGPVGTYVTDFKKSAGRDNFTMAKKAVKDLFSYLLKGTHRGKKFRFIDTEEEDKKPPSIYAENTPGVYFFLKERISLNSFSYYKVKDPGWRRIFTEKVDIVE